MIKRVFAWMISRATASRGNCDDPRKLALFAGVRGPLLEIGPGAGANLCYFPPETEWLGIEPNPFMHPYLSRTIQRLDLSTQRFRIDPGDPQGIRLPAADGSIRTVVSTHVLCSVPDLAGILGEILRVLQPGGEFLFLEHVAAGRKTRLRAFQDFIQPAWTKLGDGCHPNRETWESIEAAGFARVEIEHFRMDGGGPVAPHIVGRAVKSASDAKVRF